MKPLQRDVARLRIISNSMPVTESGCWIWTRSLIRGGYGQVNVGWETCIASRVSYMAFKCMDFDKDLLVCHTCDVTSCVNPDHLFLGTHKENSHDSKNKGRSSNGFYLGSLASASKLSESQVLEIRRIGSSMRQADLAEMFNTHQTNISLILRKKVWRHI